MSWTLLALLAGCFVCSCFGGYVAAVKGRPVLEGIIFGLFLGPFGVIAASGLPDLLDPSEVIRVVGEEPTEPPVDVDRWDMSQTLAVPRDARMPRVRT